MNIPPRLSTGVSQLDRMLGGGLLPGTLTVVAGATGIGKTQLGLQFAGAGRVAEGHGGLLFDMGCRGDSQNHADYARRLWGSTLEAVDPNRAPALDGFFAPGRRHGDYLHVFDYHGRRVTRSALGFEAWQDWQAEIARKLAITIAFIYGNLVRGVRRLVVDGIEPVERPGDSIQFELFEYIYHQVLQKESEWVARDLFREHYREHAAEAAAHAYPAGQAACMLLITTREVMLDDLIGRPLDEGDVLANANTILYLGKMRDGHRLSRGIYVAKHRGSACSDEIAEYSIGEEGLSLAFNDG
ncbi:MAG TPA: ATPase domain-containing protein [Pirellulales bacterium]|jgi:RecA/RadA recombinase|nr:ATPase domain-containing protein [Pirellulales bacterium]